MYTVKHVLFLCVLGLGFGLEGPGLGLGLEGPGLGLVLGLWILALTTTPINLGRRWGGKVTTPSVFLE